MKKIFIGGPISRAIKDGKFDVSVKKLIEGFIQQGQLNGFEILSAHVE